MKLGTTKKETKETIIGLEKHSKKTGKKAWKDIAKRLNRPSRIRAKVNVYSLNELAEKNKGKILVVPGKILGKGDASVKIDVACLDCSETARKKILAQKGSVRSLMELVEKNEKASNVVIVQ